MNVITIIAALLCIAIGSVVLCILATVLMEIGAAWEYRRVKFLAAG